MTNEIETFSLDTPYYQNNCVSCIGGRQENQDSCGITVTRRGLLVLVCDGMGGMAGGATASRIAVQTITDCISGEPEEDNLEDDNRLALVKAIQAANAAILEQASQDPSLTGMGTTVAALLINAEKAVVAHVGDSRVYQLRDHKKVFRTFDHSMVFELVRKKVVTEEQARLSAQSNVILRALGIKAELDVEVTELPYEKDDVFFLCSDGIWGTLPEPELLKSITTKQHPKVITETLAMKIHSEGIRQGCHHDNLTAAMVKTTMASRMRPKSGGFLSHLFGK